MNDYKENSINEKYDNMIEKIWHDEAHYGDLYATHLIDKLNERRKKELEQLNNNDTNKH